VGHVGAVLQNVFEHGSAGLGVNDFTAAKTHDQSNFVALFQEAPDVAQLEVQVVIIGLRSKLDFFHFDRGGVLASLLGLLGLLVLELSVVHDAANGRHRLGRDLDEIEAFLLCHAKRFVRRQDAELSTIVGDDADLGHTNAPIDSVRIL